MGYEEKYFKKCFLCKKMDYCLCVAEENNESICNDCVRKRLKITRL